MTNSKFPSPNNPSALIVGFITVFLIVLLFRLPSIIDEVYHVKTKIEDSKRNREERKVDRYVEFDDKIKVRFNDGALGGVYVRYKIFVRAKDTVDTFEEKYKVRRALYMASCKISTEYAYLNPAIYQALVIEQLEMQVKLQQFTLKIPVIVEEKIRNRFWKRRYEFEREKQKLANQGT